MQRQRPLTPDRFPAVGAERPPIALGILRLELLAAVVGVVRRLDDLSPCGDRPVVQRIGIVHHDVGPERPRPQRPRVVAFALGNRASRLPERSGQLRVGDVVTPRRGRRPRGNRRR